MMKTTSRVVAAVCAFLALGLGVLVVSLLLVKALWAWTVPDLFPGAVARGLVAQSISWLTAFKLALLMAVLVGFAGARHKEG